jgi:NAD(P)-dependent dehydrogenase (short-subunit alcohol dehydrogenase family)
VSRVLLDKIAIVTGGGQGLGEAICHRLADEGAHIVVADINVETAKQVAASIGGRADRKATAVQVNVTDEAQVETMVQRTVDEFGRLDILVSNAGVLRSGSIEEFALRDWRFVIEVNMIGYFLCCKYACRVMKEQRSGAIVQVNSKSGKKGSFKNSAYAASKFGGIRRAGNGRIWRALQRSLPWQPARLAAVGQLAVQAVRAEPRHHRRRGETKVCRPSADEARLHLRGRVQLGRVPRL